MKHDCPRWHAAWSERFVGGGPNWQISAVTVNTGGAGAAPASVAARQLFYNGSFFDQDDAPGVAAAAANDGAIATDKTALLPGETATFANYTSYSAGLNGIMVDIADLASEPSLETIDSFFSFAVGNDDTGTTTTTTTTIRIRTHQRVFREIRGEERRTLRGVWRSESRR